MIRYRVQEGSDKIILGARATGRSNAGRGHSGGILQGPFGGQHPRIEDIDDRRSPGWEASPYAAHRFLGPRSGQHCARDKKAIDSSLPYERDQFPHTAKENRSPKVLGRMPFLPAGSTVLYVLSRAIPYPVRTTRIKQCSMQQFSAIF